MYKLLKGQPKAVFDLDKDIIWELNDFLSKFLPIYKKYSNYTLYNSKISVCYELTNDEEKDNLALKVIDILKSNLIVNKMQHELVFADIRTSLRLTQEKMCTNGIFIEISPRKLNLHLLGVNLDYLPKNIYNKIVVEFNRK